MTTTKEKEKEKQIWLGETADIWSDDDQKKAWLRDAMYEDPDFPQEMAQYRKKALDALYAIVSRIENREVIWGDQTVREALLDCGQARHDELVRLLTVGCLVKLSMSRANRKAMLDDKLCINVLCVNGGKEAPDPVRGKAYLALANLTLQLRGAEDTDFAKDLLKALVLGTDKKQPLEVRSRVFGSLWSMAASAADLREMWNNLDIRYALAAAVLPEEPIEVRSNALAVIWTVAGDERIRESLWEDADLRQALLIAMAADQPSTVRVNSLKALRNLGMTVELQRPLWGCEEVQCLLLQAVSVGQPADVRASALHVLIQLAMHPRNGRKMVEAGVRDILQQAAEDEQLEQPDRQVCKFAAERLEGAEFGEEEADEEAQPDSAPVEETGAVDGGEAASATEGIPLDAETSGTQSSTVDPSASADPSAAGTLQSGVLQRAAAGGYATSES